MPRSKEAQPVDEDHEFTTIDDVIGQAEELLDSLNRLGEYRHPLDVRRGVGNVIDKDERSKVLKAGAKTYFFDIKETKDEKPYLLITESRFKGEGDERERSSIVVFQQNIQEFAQAISDLAAKIAE